MSIKPLIIGAALLGSASLVAADPDIERGEHVWNVLSAGDRIGPDSKAVIELAEPVRLHELELSGVLGRTTIDRLAIQFADGTTQIVAPQITLVRGDLYTVDLGGDRHVVGAIVYGSSSPDAAFQLLGA